jgi:hypothetical protein
MIIHAFMDDSPEKNLMNSRYNTAFPESCNYMHEGVGRDNFLRLTLGPILWRAHEVGPMRLEISSGKTSPDGTTWTRC